MGELKLINLADVQIEEIEWLWKPYIPKGKVTLVRGMPGEGKTMVLSSLVAALTNGDPLFNEEERHEPVSCIYQSAEDVRCRRISARTWTCTVQMKSVPS